MKYKFDKVFNDRWSIWYKELPKRGARIGVYKIFDFDTGEGFQPDFLLLLKSKEGNSAYIQVFIEGMRPV